MAVTRRRVLQGGAASAAGIFGAGFGASALLARGARAEAGVPAGLEAPSGWSGGGVRSIGESLVAEPRYRIGFPHFDYVNPNAPKGGTVRLSELGRFDTFNPFNVKGTAEGNIGLVLESLMTPSLDEGSTHYAALAEWMERSPLSDWVAFRLRDEARWHDGRPVTVEDVRESFVLMVTKGRPFFRFYYQNVTEVVDEGDRIVRFRFDQTGNKELPHIMGQLVVLPAHYWAERDFGEATLEPMLGSGPYRVADFEAGRFAEYERVGDYWGADQPFNVGKNNIDRIRYEYYGDRDIEFEAFKAGQIDFWTENRAKRWALQFDFPAIARGVVVKREVALEGPQPVQGFVFNTRRAKFADRRVRRAFALAYDFEWTNKAIFYGQYARPLSYFQGSDDLMAAGAPEGAELALLEPFRAELPPELFAEPFGYPINDGSGRARGALREATRLLREAGYAIRGGRLIDPDGARVTLEFLAFQKDSQPNLDPFLANLRQLGVDASLRIVDQAQYVDRLRGFDYDMITSGWSNSESPGNEQRDYWGSAAADQDGGRNAAGVRNPAIDALIDKIIFAEDRAALAAASRALDRVLLWENYAVLQLYTPFERIAHWNMFGAPEPLPSRAVAFPTVWWVDAAKASSLERS